MEKVFPKALAVPPSEDNSIEILSEENKDVDGGGGLTAGAVGGLLASIGRMVRAAVQAGGQITFQSGEIAFKGASKSWSIAAWWLKAAGFAFDTVTFDQAHEQWKKQHTNINNRINQLESYRDLMLDELGQGRSGERYDPSNSGGSSSAVSGDPLVTASITCYQWGRYRRKLEPTRKRARVTTLYRDSAKY